MICNLPRLVLHLLLLAGLVALSACDSGTGAGSPSPDTTGADTSSASEGTPLATATEGSLTVELWADAPLAVGLNHVRYLVFDGGQPVTTAAVAQRPVMHMMDEQHACPLRDPDDQAGADGAFAADLVFTMASTAEEPWNLALDVTPAGGAKTTVTFPALEVQDRPVRKTLTLGSGAMASKLVLTLNFAGGSPHVGVNDYVLTVHEPAMGMMTFPPVTDVAITATPEMPSMGHGSPGNIQPSHTGHGYYAGKVNFMMAGDWVLTFDLARGGQPLGQVEYAFDL